MSATLRIVLMLSALITGAWILGKIYKCKVKLKDAIFWFCMALLLAVLGIAPEIAYWCANVIGIQTPVNFVFLLMIALMIEKLFTMSIIISQLEDKVTVLSAEVALRTHDEMQRLEKLEEEIEDKEE